VPATVGREEAEVRDYRAGRAQAEVCVIIPAHNEASTLSACLRSLIRQDFEGVIRLIISNNGSSDGTLELAQSWADRFARAGHETWVLHLPIGNKCAALNAADAAAEGLPRIYLDADVELSSTNCVSEVVATFSNDPGILMCCPRLRIAEPETFVTRHWGRVWTQLPWVCNDAIGGGFYAVSADGRKRWGRFPDLLSEDSFVQAQFRKHERRVLEDCQFQIHLPDGLHDLLKVRTRQLSGNRQLARQINGARQTNGDWGRATFPLAQRLQFIVSTPGLWPDLPLYFFVNACAHWRARRREALGTSVWERDSTRQARPVNEADEAELASYT
jgi:glycosyltransferase involved in cell wall biosynthesis